MCKNSVKMSANYVASVPKLRGRENYSEWVFAAENFLVLEGISNCIKAEDSTVSMEERKKSEVNNDN